MKIETEISPTVAANLTEADVTKMVCEATKQAETQAPNRWQPGQSYRQVFKKDRNIYLVAINILGNDHGQALIGLPSEIIELEDR